MTKKRKSTLPSASHILVADMVWRDEATGKFCILGAFEWLQSEAEPLIGVEFDMYFRMTNVYGSHDVAIDIGKPNDSTQGRRIIRNLGAIESYDPKRVLTMACSVGPIVLPAWGAYEIRVITRLRMHPEIMNVAGVHQIWALYIGQEPEQLKTNGKD